MNDISRRAQFRERYSKLVDDPDAFFESLRTPLPKSFRVNTLKANPESVCQRLESFGFGLKPVPFYADAYISNNPELGATIDHFSGAIYLQEITSMLPPLLVRDELSGAESVLDACAAPGSKTTQLAAMMNNRGQLVANDIEYERIRALKFNIERAGALNVVVTNYDLRSFPEMQFDIILLDAPCTAEGTMRKDPKKFAWWSARMIPRSAGRQRRLIVRAFDLLARGGLMIYSTCTFAPEENEAIVSHLLNERQATLESIEIKDLRLAPGVPEWEGEIYNHEVAKTARLYPHHNDTGGFFLAKIRK